MHYSVESSKQIVFAILSILHSFGILKADAKSLTSLSSQNVWFPQVTTLRTESMKNAHQEECTWDTMPIRTMPMRNFDHHHSTSDIWWCAMFLMGIVPDGHSPWWASSLFCICTFWGLGPTWPWLLSRKWNPPLTFHMPFLEYQNIFYKIMVYVWFYVTWFVSWQTWTTSSPCRPRDMLFVLKDTFSIEDENVFKASNSICSSVA